MPGRDTEAVTLLLTGDVMTGRGVDQVLPHPSPPRLYEGYATSALDYVDLAERANGPIPKPVAFDYVWGDALAALARARPDVRIVNLETSVTRSEDYLPKGINYRMNPANVPCLTAAGIDCCVLANNHVLDWTEAGLLETLDTLAAAEIKTAGAGRTRAEAEAPAVLDLPGNGRVLVFAFGAMSSGVPPDWAAGENRPGVNFLPDLSDATAGRIARQVGAAKRPGDIVVASLHWGSNWGYEIPGAHRRFAQRLIAAAGVDIVHGHSSHHVRAIEVFRDRPILYGCGDFLTDYEGITGYEAFRDDLALAYLPTMDAASGRLLRMEMIPFQMRRFRLNRASRKDARWLHDVLNREGGRFGTRVALAEDNRLVLAWD
ncbi:MAG: CapA family protein [Alphaproteobacteria bacterium]|nr:CapA family protein [Alphaproteobacteria bacterium]